MRNGLLGDVKFFDGIGEMRIDVGPGYRVKSLRSDMRAKTKTTPFDSAEILDTPEAIAAYLGDAIASGNAAEFQDALNVVARARGMTEIAKLAGLGRENLYNALRPDAHPRFDTIQRVVSALGVRLTVQPVA